MRYSNNTSFTATEVSPRLLSSPCFGFFFSHFPFLILAGEGRTGLVWFGAVVGHSCASHGKFSRCDPPLKPNINVRCNIGMWSPGLGPFFYKSSTKDKIDNEALRFCNERSTGWEQRKTARVQQPCVRSM